MSGGFAGYDSQALTPQRLPAIQAVLAEINADVVGLVDTFRWDKLYSNEQLRDMFGYEHVACINLNDDRLGTDSNGLALLSRQPWKRLETVRLATRDALKAVFELNGRDITVVLAYLDDLKEEVRLQQVKALPSATVVDVLMGDLNTIAPVDVAQTVQDTENFYAINPALRQSLEPIVRDMQRGEVITYLRKKGFVDAGLHAGSTLPTELFPARTPKPFLRLDYCLYGARVDVTNFGVHDSDTANRASDHLPISFTVV